MATTVDVSEIVDGARLNAYHLRIIGLCAGLLFFEGFDLQAVSYAAPAMSAALGFSKPMLGPVFSGGQLGLMLGALLFGIAGDRWGRKRVFILCGLDFGIGSILTALTPSYDMLLAWRVVAGFGLGGAGPIAITIATDYCPRRIRAALTMIMYLGFTTGGVFAGVVNTFLAAYGWRTVFYVGGVVPILFAPVLMAWLPESLNFLVANTNNGTRICGILDRLEPTRRHAADSVFVMPQAYGREFQVPELFRSGYAARTILLWACFFISLITLFTLSSWLPTLLAGQGISQPQIVYISAVSQVGATLGAMAGARLIIAFRPLLVAAAGYAAGALSLVIMGSIAAGFLPYMIMGFSNQFFLIGVQSIVNAVSGQIYPPKIRATGVGWGIGIGRFGGFLGPMIFGGLLGLGWSFGHLFMIAALPILTTAVLVYILSDVAKKPPRQTRLLPELASRDENAAA